MPEPGRFPVLAASVLLAALVGGGLILILAEPPPAPPAREEGPGPEEHAEPLPPPALPDGPLDAAPSAEPERRETQAEGSPGPGRGPSAEPRGIAVLEDGTPLAGVAVCPEGRLAGSQTRGDGTFRYGRGEVCRVSGPSGFQLVAAEGGQILEQGEKTLVRPDSATFRLVFRERDDVTILRFCDGFTGHPIESPDPLHVRLRFEGRTRADQSLRCTSGGWFTVARGGVPLGLSDEETVPWNRDTDRRFRAAVTGYEWADVERRLAPGRHEIEVRPVEPVATGRVVLPDSLAKPPVTAEIRRIEEGRTHGTVVLARGAPSRHGEFRLFDLPRGRYEIEVSAELDGKLVRARKVFEIGGAPAELGEISLTPYAAIRARVIDADGRPVLQADVVAVRTDEEPEQARRIAPGDSGWVVYEDLEPDLPHRVVVLGLAYSLERTVRTPGAFGETVETEFRLPDRLVDCHLRFFVEVTGPAAKSEGPRREDAGRFLLRELPIGRFGREGSTIRAGLLAGTYTLTRVDEFDLPLGTATLTVPPQPEFRAEVVFQVSRDE